MASISTLSLAVKLDRGVTLSAFVQGQLHSVVDERGMLVVAQHVFGFEVRRVFWIVGQGGQLRGAHRHHVTRQALIAVSGRVEVNVDDGLHSARVILASPERYLLIEPDDWHTMQLNDGAVLLVFASHEYDPADYIHEPYQDRKAQ